MNDVHEIEDQRLLVERHVTHGRLGIWDSPSESPKLRAFTPSKTSHWRQTASGEG